MIERGGITPSEGLGAVGVTVIPAADSRLKDEAALRRLKVDHHRVAGFEVDGGLGAVVEP